MLNIYYGRECVNKEKFVFDKIAESGYSPDHRVIIIVPDQYTLEAERQAFRYLDVQSLIGLDVFSMSRLSHRILEKLGGGRQTFIDKYGRQMLLTKITREEEENLEAFRGNAGRSAFVEMINNFISELKQYGAGPETLAEIVAGLPEGGLLRKKLSDLEMIYRRYQEAIEGKYTDSEDYLSLTVERIGRSELIRGSRVWIYGFDSFAPKAMEILREMMAAAEEVNVVLTYDRDCRDEGLFELTGVVLRKLTEAAKEAGCGVGKKQRISEKDYPARCCPASRIIERELYAVGSGERNVSDISLSKGESDGAADKAPDAPAEAGMVPGFHILEAASYYNEAESAAAFVLGLLREEGYRYRDVALICNDQTLRASITSRVFQEYGIPLFHDNKRGILNSGLAMFLISILQTVQNRYRTEDVFKTLKSGFSGLGRDEIEQLENYALKYRIRGTMWKRPFEKGAFEYGADELAALEEIRQRVMALFSGIESLEKGSRTVREFVTGFYRYLTEDLELLRRLDEVLDRIRKEGPADYADEMEQIWAMVIRIFDQIVELTGEDSFDLEGFTTIFTVGLDQIEVGVLPTSIDDMMMGTMQRTRTGPLRALVVVGANEGVLPAETGPSGLFALEELNLLADKGYEICKADQVRVQEERLAIYRNLSKPAEHLWISYSGADEDGGTIRPSEIIGVLREIFPRQPIEKDILNQMDETALVGGRLSTLRHLSSALRKGRQQGVSPAFRQAERWFEINEPELMKKLHSSLSFENETEPLTDECGGLLFSGRGPEPRSLSPSRLESFARCPFAYYVDYGLRPEELRVFEAASREIGDLYHSCLMRATIRLTREDRWDTVTEEDCSQIISEELARETAHYRDGLFAYGNEERYKTGRIRETCGRALWILVQHARAGDIRRSRYETAFGRGRPIRPIEVNVDGEPVYIEGKIDRMDVLGDGRLKIIDYKSGNLTLKQEEIRSGYRLQLMLYLKAALEGVPGSADGAGPREPAGVFYFHIQDPRINLEGMPEMDEEAFQEAIEKELKKKFKLTGIMIDEPEVIQEIAGEFEGYSDVAPVKRNKDGTVKGSPAGALISEEEFEALQEAVDETVRELVQRMTEGDIKIWPMRQGKGNTPCQYCRYKSVCRFDLGFRGCEYNRI